MTGRSGGSSPMTSITTRAELDALPVGSVVLSDGYKRDADGIAYPHAFQRLYDGSWYRGGRIGTTDADCVVPATLLHRPETTPTPEPDPDGHGPTGMGMG